MKPLQLVLYKQLLARRGRQRVRSGVDRHSTVYGQPRTRTLRCHGEVLAGSSYLRLVVVGLGKGLLRHRGGGVVADAVLVDGDVAQVEALGGRELTGRGGRAVGRRHGAVGVGGGGGSSRTQQRAAPCRSPSVLALKLFSLPIRGRVISPLMSDASPLTEWTDADRRSSLSTLE